MRQSKRRAKRRGNRRALFIPAASILPVVLVILVGMIGFMAYRGILQAHSATKQSNPVDGGRYLYYTLKQPNGFVLARSLKGSNGQPLSSPQPVATFGNGFGQLESDDVFFMHLSPDARYLAIDGTRDHGEQVWIFDTQSLKLNLVPANVLGNFLHWLPGASGHAFLYRPMLPLGPNVPTDGVGWNPGLWIVDAATGAHTNIDIHMSSAFLVDAAPSPDGSRIVYSTSAGIGMGSDKWLMRSDGSGLIHLFSTPAGVQSITGLFAWSPDGRSIAYEQLSDGPSPFLPAGLWVMNSDGTRQHQLAEADGGHGFTLSWSPDSRSIAFVARINTTDRQANLDAQSLQSAIAIVDVASAHSWLVATPAQTGAQINAYPTWIFSANGSESITFAAFNPFNRVLGGMPRYWSAQLGSRQSHALLVPLTATLTHIVAL